MSVIFQPSDLNQHGRAILDAARQGGARIRDKDGMALLVLPEERVEALETASRYASEFLALDRAMPLTTAEGREAVRISPWPWLADLNDEDLDQFVTELRESLLVAFKTGAIKPTERLIAEWRATAEQLSDPARRRILLEPLNANDYVAVRPPEMERSTGSAPGLDVDPSGSGV